VLSAQEQHVFSPRLLSTFRVGFSRASFFFLGNVPSEVQAGQVRAEALDKEFYVSNLAYGHPRYFVAHSVRAGCRRL
jgi:hypothetical protein